MNDKSVRRSIASGVGLVVVVLLATAVFGAGGGVYTLEGNQYTEYLEYCNAREWEGNTFQFTVKIQGDTLTQSGIEKIENLGLERLNIEKYTRLKN